MSIERIAEALRAARLTIATAEASAGGQLATELTHQPGSSAYFRGGVVPYDDRSKIEVLGASAAIFLQHGSVSAEACLAMAEAVRRLFQADIGLAETSIAGPGGGSPAKPVGLCYVAVESPRGREVRQHGFQGDRAQNRASTATAALSLLGAHLGVV